MRGFKTAAKGLRRARRLMNNGGAHWTQNAWRKGTGNETRYCYLGGLQAAMFGVGPEGAVQEDTDRFKKPAYAAAIEASAQVISPYSFSCLEAQRDKALTRLASGRRPLAYWPTSPEIVQMHYLTEVESMIISFNDGRAKGWADVEEKLIAAAELLDSKLA